MPIATISFDITYTTGELATLKEMFPNANGSVPSSVEVVANVKAWVIKQLNQKYRGFTHDKATAAVVNVNLTVS
jgi:hypothetical protein